LLLLGRDARHFRRDRRQFYRYRSARMAAGFVDNVERHLRPPAVAVAIRRNAVGEAGATRGF
jgi:hypothetical protein